MKNAQLTQSAKPTSLVAEVDRNNRRLEVRREDESMRSMVAVNAGIARPITEEEDEAIHQEAVAERLARFKGKGGKHGPLANVKTRVAVRISRESSVALTQIARRVGTKRAPLVAQILEIIARIPQEQWHRTMAKLEDVAEG